MVATALKKQLSLQMALLSLLLLLLLILQLANDSVAADQPMVATPTAERTRRKRNIRKAKSTIDTGEVRCVVDDKLEALVKQGSIRMFVIYHNQESEEIAKAYSKCTNWVSPLKLGRTKYFESIMYNNTLLSSVNTTNINIIDNDKAHDTYKTYSFDYLGVKSTLVTNSEYIITSTYKTIRSGFSIKDSDIQLNSSTILNMLTIGMEHNYDVVPFLRSRVSLQKSILYFHRLPGKIAYDSLLIKMGFPRKFIRSIDEKAPFFRNVFIIKPLLLLKVTRLMQEAIRLVNTDPDLGKVFEANSLYKGGSVETAMNNFGTKYYQLHPFIFERLPSFFVYALKAKVCIDNDHCPGNYL